MPVHNSNFDAYVSMDTVVIVPCRGARRSKNDIRTLSDGSRNFWLGRISTQLGVWGALKAP